MAVVLQPGFEASAWSHGVTSPATHVLPKDTLRMYAAVSSSSARIAAGA